MISRGSRPRHKVPHPPLRNLRRSQFDLLTLFDLSNRLTGILESESALRTILLTGMAHAGTDKAALLATDPTSTCLEWTVVRGINASEFPSLAINDPFVTQLKNGAKSLSIPSSSLSRLGFSLGIPLKREDRLVGALLLGPSRIHAGYPDDVLQVIMILATFAGTIIERDRLLTHLRQSDTLSAMGRLVAGTAHELKNPLSAILGYCQLIQQSPAAPPSTFHQDVKAIHQQAERAMDIVQKLLSFSRQRPLEKQWVNVNDVVRTVLQLREYHTHTDGLTMNIELAPDLPLVQADAAALQQILINLIQNGTDAIKTRFGGQAGKGHVRLATRLAPQRVEVLVEDNGCGIPKSLLPRIFEPFYTTKPVGEGTGLGLSISHSLVTQHGGELLCKSEEGTGTLFILSLPLGRSLESA